MNLEENLNKVLSSVITELEHNISNKELVLWGAGQGGQLTVNILKQLPKTCLVQNCKCRQAKKT